MLSTSFWSHAWPVTKGIEAYVKMVDPVSITAVAIEILAAAFDASKKLYELSQSIQGHSKEVRDMHEEFDGLITILSGLQEKSRNTLSSKDAMLKAPLKGCFDCCEELNKSLEGLGRPNIRDWLKLQFRNKTIKDIKTRLASYKEQLSVALQIIEL